ncbi:MAG: DUF1972 domain-containing protein [Rubricoccaceae bacterium]|nr:DUF1972 domain-containing protein [Rubricoccaceae bacterium]
MLRKRIAIIGSRGIPARYGGFETFAEELSTRLVARGVDVTVYCEGAGGPTMHKGVHLAYVPTPHLGGLTTILHDFRALWHARKRFDIVYMLGYGTSIFCLLPKLHRTPIWMNMDGVEWKREKWGFFGKSWWKTMEFVAQYIPDLMIADAEAIRNFLSDRHRHMPECAVIPYGANVINTPPDVSALNDWRVLPRQYHLIVSRLEPENHVLELFEGYIASQSPYPLVALGTTRKPNRYTRALQDLARENERIILPGPVYDDRIQALRYYARTYLHGHSVGGTNPSLLEAMGSGSPVIAHENVFNREVAQDTAVYFKNSDDVANLIRILDKDEGLRRSLGQRAKERVLETYSWERVTSMYLRLLEVGVEEPLEKKEEAVAVTP